MQCEKRSHGIEVLQCPCGGLRKVVQQVTTREQIRETLQRLGLGSEPVKTQKARRSPQVDLGLDASSQCDGVDPPAPDYAT